MWILRGAREQIAFGDSVRDFARQELNRGADERDGTGRFPAEPWKKSAKFGTFALPLPVDYGGLAVICSRSTEAKS
ncbi:MAG: hypothetical protein DME36_10845 [Verrucomicrobia bacterium]|nr:MAG: hypothetical protein DME36_10845 [Verrucomicrobiota bacterium]PYL37549.1 MAG: hypothetical protein DMF34_09990 [Verrucomicrobiota bacterium]